MQAVKNKSQESKVRQSRQKNSTPVDKLLSMDKAVFCLKVMRMDLLFSGFFLLGFSLTVFTYFHIATCPESGSPPFNQDHC